MTQISRVVERVQRRLRIAQSLHATVYTEDPIIEAIQSAFDYYYNLRWWPQFRLIDTYTVNSTTGAIEFVSAPPAITFLDIRNVWEVGSKQPIAMLPNDCRPSEVVNTGRFKYYYYDPTSFIKLAPLQTGKSVELEAYVKPAAFDIDSVVEFDETLLVLNGAIRHLAGSGANEADMLLVQAELAEYWRVYDNRAFGQDVATRPPYVAYPTEWQCG